MKEDGRKNDKKDVGPLPGPSKGERQVLQKKARPSKPKNPYGGHGERALASVWEEGYEAAVAVRAKPDAKERRMLGEALENYLEEALLSLVLSVEAFYRAHEALSSYLKRAKDMVAKTCVYVDHGSASAEYLDEFGGGVKHLALLSDAASASRKTARGRTLAIEGTITTVVAKLGPGRVMALIDRFSEEPIVRSEKWGLVMSFYERERGRKLGPIFPGEKNRG